MRDYDREIEELKARVERAEDERNNYERLYETAKAELDELREAVGITTEKLGHSGHDGEDLHDAVGTIERLVEGKDVDEGLDLQGVAGQIEARMREHGQLAEICRRMLGTDAKGVTSVLQAWNEQERADEVRGALLWGGRGHE